MKNLFSYDGFLIQSLKKILDCSYISALWFLFSLPIITVGASTSALFHTVERTFLYDRGYVWNAFWGAFKENFKKATLAWLIVLVGGMIAILDSVMFYMFLPKYTTLTLIIGVYLLWLVIVWGIYVFSYIIRFQDKMKTVFKNSFLMMFTNMFCSMLAFFALIIAIVIVYFFPLLALFMPCLYACLICYLMQKTFKKYLSPEDLEKWGTSNGIDG